MAHRIATSRWLRALLCAAVASYLLIPVALGWQHTTLSRQYVLDGATSVVGNSRVEAKFVHLDQGVPELVRSQPSLNGQYIWVVASTSPKLVPSCGGFGCLPPTYSVALVPDQANAIVVGWGELGNVTAWPSYFDRLRDVQAPSWWPFTLPLPVALALAALSLGVGLRRVSSSPLSMKRQRSSASMDSAAG